MTQQTREQDIQAAITAFEAVREALVAAGPDAEFDDLGRKTLGKLADAFDEVSEADRDGDSDGAYDVYDVPAFEEIGLEGHVTFYVVEDSGKYYDLSIPHECRYHGFDYDRREEGELTTLEQVDQVLAALRALGGTNVVNLTPHAINVKVGEELTVYPPSGVTVRVKTEDTPVAPVAGVPVVQTRYTDAEGMPEPVPGTIYLVSTIAAQALVGRNDVYIPDSGATAKRNDKGQIEYVTRFIKP